MIHSIRQFAAGFTGAAVGQPPAARFGARDGLFGIDCTARRAKIRRLPGASCSGAAFSRAVDGLYARLVRVSGADDAMGKSRAEALYRRAGTAYAGLCASHWQRRQRFASLDFA